MSEETIVLGEQGNMLELDETGQIIPVMEVLVIEPLHDDVVIPFYASEGDSGMDVSSREDYVLQPGETKLFKLGFKMQIPRHPLHTLGYRWEAQMRPRSGLSLKTMLRVGNSPGTVDNFYISEVGVILTNSASNTYTVDTERAIIGDELAVTSVELNTPNSGVVRALDGKFYTSRELHELGITELTDIFMEGSLLIRKGDRIAQMVLVEVIRPVEIAVGKVDPEHGRSGGFGSTGV